jgi:hypothetical protein
MRLIAGAVALSLSLGGCQNPPVALSDHYTPRESARPAKLLPGETACRVQLGDIHDLRESADEAVGTIGYRPLRLNDTAGWVRSGILTITRSPKINFVDANADLVLNIDLLKAYIRSAPTSKSANVVIRVHYAVHGLPADETLFRGLDAGMNWNSEDGEAQSALDRALSQILVNLSSDIVAHCSPAAGANAAAH